jgi:hypothetical protein
MGPRQVWLPALGVWARAPTATAAPDALEPAPEPAPAPAEAARLPPRACSVAAAAAGEPDAVCAICLEALPSAALAERAVLAPCMHAYHRACAARWLAIKPACPLCAAGVSALLVDIRADGTHREESPPPAAPPPDAGFELRAESGGDRPALERGSARGAAGAARGRRRGGGPPAAAGASAYAARVQRHLDARAAIAVDPSTVEAAAEAEAALARRRRVYDGGLWAAPGAGGGPTAWALGGGGGAGRARRVQEWAERDLRALTGSGDVTLLRAFVVSLLAARPAPARGRAVAAAGVDNSNGRGCGDARRDPLQDPVGALRPFLGVHAAHFWHELLCFADAPFTVATYDRLAAYECRGEGETGGGGGGEDHAGAAEVRERAAAPPSPPPPPRRRSRSRSRRRRLPRRSRSRSRSRRRRSPSRSRSRRRRSPSRRRSRSRSRSARRSRSPPRARARSRSPGRWRLWRAGDGVE